MIGTVLAVDPGKRTPGVAAFVDGRLVAATCLSLPIAGCDVATAAETARAVVTWCYGTLGGAPDVLVVEWPQVYTHDKRGKKDPNDLLPLAGVDVAVAAMLNPARIVSYKPREWKGTVDPDAMLDRIKARLVADGHGELARVDVRRASLEHNAIDAVGVGMKFLGRLERKRVYAR